MIGYFRINRLGGEDDAGSAISADVSSQMDPGIEGTLYLPPYLRPAQCGIHTGSVVYGVMDDVTGIGVALMGMDDADFGYFFDADIQIKKNLEVAENITSTTGDITAQTGDVVATGISLIHHTHPIGTLHTQDGSLIATGVAAVVAGNPFPETTFSSWITAAPGEP